MAGYLAGDVEEWIYIDIADQHPDSMRFIKDCEEAIGEKVQILRNEQYQSTEACFCAFGGFKNAVSGFAPCTAWLKKRVRKEWEDAHQDYDLTYVWGFDFDEQERAIRLIEDNPQAKHEFPLIDRYLKKSEVHGLFEMKFSFKRPSMYEMGYPNNNCVGCVKGGMSYWNKIRVDFPEVFEKRARLERKLGHSILKDEKGPVFLDELDPERGRDQKMIFPECGVMCYLAQT